MQNKTHKDRTVPHTGACPEGRRPEDGLTAEEADRRRLEYGDNRAQGRRKDTIGFRLRRAFLNPFSVVLLVLAAISCLVDIILAPAADRRYTTVIIISLMLFVSGCVRLTQELKAKKITDRLIRLVDTRVRVKRSGSWIGLDAAELVVGDLVQVAAGERVPADIRLTKTQDCFISQSAITGESELREKCVGRPDTGTEPDRDSRAMAYAGTTVVSGSFEGIVTAVGRRTVYGEIAPSGARRRQGYEQGANSIAWVLIRFMALLVPLVFIASGLTKGNWVSAFLFALSVAVGLMPELLPIVITACLAKGSFNMSQKQTVVKNVNAMQGFGSMDMLCIDKTGTLTEDALLLEYDMDILGNEEPLVLDAAYLNSFYHAGVCSHLDTAILRVRDTPRQDGHYSDLIQRWEKLDELPYDYSRKLSSVLLCSGEDRVLLTKGGPDAVLSRCSHVYYKGACIPMDGDRTASVHAVVDEMLEDGMKVLAVAAGKLSKNELVPADETDLVLLGYLAFFDAPKKSAAGAMQKLRDRHVGTKVLTGDHVDVAVSVCRRLGMNVTEVMTGRELDGLSDNDAQVKVENTWVFAELSPAQKARIVEILQSNGHTVGFLADGMNDLPAVMAADVGLSVDTAVPSVKESADVILLKKDLNVLESGITEGRRAFANMSKYVKITASSNLGNIFAIVFASVLLPFFPMTSMQLLLLNLLYDILCLVLPWDRVDPDMVCRPAEWSGKTLSRFMLLFGPISSVFDILTFVFLFYGLCPAVCGGAFGALAGEAQARFISLFQTGWFLESMWTQVLILHLLRTDRPAFWKSRASAPVLLVTLLGVITFSLLPLTGLGTMLGMTPLPLYYFAFLFLNVLGYLLVVTLAKWLYRKHYRHLL